MSYGSEPADLVMRYSLEGAELALKLSGLAAKNFAVFAYAVLKDQKKTRGKTHLARMLREQRPLKFFTVPADQMKDFAREAKKRGLLFVPIRSKQKPSEIEIVVFADDAAKVSRVMELLKLDIVPAGEAAPEQAAPRPLPRVSREEQEEPALPLPDESPASEEPFQKIDWSGFFDEPQSENFPTGQESESPSAPSSPGKGFFSSRDERHNGERRSVRETLNEIRAALAKKMKSMPQKMKTRDQER
jgi:hypothetical protein